MSNSLHHHLPYILPNQAQKHITHNEAILKIDQMIQLSVLSADLPEPPTSVTDGDRYIVPENATGEWQSQDHKIATRTQETWSFLIPQTGWMVWDRNEQKITVFSNNNWIYVESEGGGENTPPSEYEKIGINTQADDYNKLSVRSKNTLLTNAGDDARLTINKAETGHTASVVFQTNYSGRAEFGLTGNDDFHLKVTPDGQNFQNAMQISAETGNIAFDHSISIGAANNGAKSEVNLNNKPVLASNIIQTQMIEAKELPEATDRILSDFDTIITPSRVGSGVLLTVNITFEADRNGMFYLLRNGEEIGSARSADNRLIGIAVSPFDTNMSTTMNTVAITYLDLPQSDQPTTYQLGFRTKSAVPFYLNRTQADLNILECERGSSRLIAQEI
jgi:hypothetical protein